MPRWTYLQNASAQFLPTCTILTHCWDSTLPQKRIPFHRCINFRSALFSLKNKHKVIPAKWHFHHIVKLNYCLQNCIESRYHLCILDQSLVYRCIYFTTNAGSDFSFISSSLRLRPSHGFCACLNHAWTADRCHSLTEGSFVPVLGQEGARPSCDDPEVEIAYEDPSGCDKVMSEADFWNGVRQTYMPMNNDVQFIPKYKLSLWSFLSVPPVFPSLQYFLCSNGTLTEESCENGLMFSGKGAVHDNCDYHWRVDCGERPFERACQSRACAADEWSPELTLSL